MKTLRVAAGFLLVCLLVYWPICLAVYVYRDNLSTVGWSMAAYALALFIGRFMDEMGWSHKIVGIKRKGKE